MCRLAALCLLWSPPTAAYGSAARTLWTPSAAAGSRPAALRAPPAVRATGPCMNAIEGGAFEGRIAEFAPRTELPRVRSQLSKLIVQLDDAVARQDFASAAMLRDDVAELRTKDPAVMARSLRAELERHVAREAYGEAARCRDELLVLRRFLPQYQLAGLWKGNYPKHGDETVRLHYSGEMLYATKVTGDEHVPAGEVTFRANLEAPIAPGDAIEGFGGADDGPGVRVEVLSISSDGAHEQREVRTGYRVRARRWRRLGRRMRSCTCTWATARLAHVAWRRCGDGCKWRAVAHVHVHARMRRRRASRMCMRMRMRMRMRMCMCIASHRIASHRIASHRIASHPSLLAPLRRNSAKAVPASSLPPLMHECSQCVDLSRCPVVHSLSFAHHIILFAKLLTIAGRHFAHLRSRRKHQRSPPEVRRGQARRLPALR